MIANLILTAFHTHILLLSLFYFHVSSILLVLRVSHLYDIQIQHYARFVVLNLIHPPPSLQPASTTGFAWDVAI